MAESEDLLDRTITAIVTRVSGPTVTALAFLIGGATALFGILYTFAFRRATV